jgi:hypothetical protein
MPYGLYLSPNVSAHKCFAVLYRVILTKMGALYLASIPLE